MNLTQQTRKRAQPARNALVPSVAGNPLAPYMETVEIACEDCGGDGRDMGSVSIDRFSDPVCPTCKGAKTQTVTRNYLSEAFAIARDDSSTRQVDRKHLVAIIRYARQHVSALFELPEVA
jgi:hypothetical protein